MANSYFISKGKNNKFDLETKLFFLLISMIKTQSIQIDYSIKYGDSYIIYSLSATKLTND